jgi:hypothetical protein
MSYPSVSPGSYQIDVVDQVGRAYRAVLDNAQLVGEIALLPYIVVLAIALIAALIAGHVFFAGLIAMVIHAIALLVFVPVFIVRWHRFLLLGESISGGLIPPGWAAFVTAWVKLGVAVLVGWVVLILIGLLPPHFITVPLSIIGGVALALLTLRVSLIFPAAAIARPVGFQTAWHWVTGNYWRLFVSALACYLPFAIAELVVSWIAALFPSLFWIVFEAMRLALSFAGAAIVVALLSHLYRDIVGIEPMAPPA